MATIEDMALVVNNVYHNSGEMADRILKLSSRKFSSIVMDLLYQALREVEDNGRYYNGGYWVDDDPCVYKLCTYWLVGDYIVTYLTNDLNFNADMLTEDMMGNLIIEEA